MKQRTRIIARQLVTVAALAAVLSSWKPLGAATEIQLPLNGHRWEKPTVKYWINLARDVSPTAVSEVLSAFDDWSEALSGVVTAPVLEMAAQAREADIVVELRLRPKHNRFGRPRPLGGGIGFHTSGCALRSAAIEIAGQELGQSPQDARIRNLSRHLVGHALGLGDIACPDGPVPCTNDLMESMHHRDAIPPTDVAISMCDLTGIAAIYTAPACAAIPTSIDFSCD